jgi:CheY-like chemotaxis protein
MRARADTIGADLLFGRGLNGRGTRVALTFSTTPSEGTAAVIRILIVDDHPAMRAGLSAVLRAEPGLVPLDAASSVADLWPTLNRTKPDVVVLDYHLPAATGSSSVAASNASCRLPRGTAVLGIRRRVAHDPDRARRSRRSHQQVSARQRALRRDSARRARRAGAAADLTRAARRGRPRPGHRRAADPRHDTREHAGQRDGGHPRRDSKDVMHRIDRMIKRLKIEIPAPRSQAERASNCSP